MPIEGKWIDYEENTSDDAFQPITRIYIYEINLETATKNAFPPELEIYPYLWSKYTYLFR